MVGKSKNIETGADRLIALISEKKKIELNDAAKQIGVGKNVVQEWSEMLEQEGLIKIQYNLSKTWLLEKEITHDDIVTNAKEISSERDAFARKIDIAITSLQRDTASFEEVHQKFTEIQSNIKTEMDAVKKELAQLERYESLKKNLDKEIELQKTAFEKAIREYSSQLQAEEAKYAATISEVEKERKTFDFYKQSLISLKVAHTDLASKISDFQRKISQTETRIHDMESTAETILKDLHIKKTKSASAVLAPIIAQSQKTIASQEELVKKIQETSKRLGTYAETNTKINESFKGFFQKNINTERLIEDIENEKNMLLKEMSDLRAKVDKFSLLSASKSVKEQMTQIEKEILAIEAKHTSFRQKIEKLLESIRK